MQTSGGSAKREHKKDYANCFSSYICGSLASREREKETLGEKKKRERGKNRKEERIRPGEKKVKRKRAAKNCLC